MSSNSRGSYRTTPANMMRAYDKLPPTVRKALANAAFNYAPQPVLTRVRRDGWSCGAVIGLIRAWDRQEIEKVDRKLGRAP